MARANINFIYMRDETTKTLSMLNGAKVSLHLITIPKLNRVSSLQDAFKNEFMKEQYFDYAFWLKY